MEKQPQNIERTLVRKLTRYYRYLNEQRQLGVEMISSNRLAQLMSISASQVRQDFNRLMYEGHHGVGYRIDTILEKIKQLLLLQEPKNMIIVGAGSLGQSLCKYKELYHCGFSVKAFFDINPQFENAILHGIPVFPMSQLHDYIRENNIVAAVLSLPTEATKSVAHQLYDYGVRLFLNFNPVFFDFGDDVYIENVHMDDNIMMLSYKSGLL